MFELKEIERGVAAAADCKKRVRSNGNRPVALSHDCKQRNSATLRLSCYFEKRAVRPGSVFR